LVEAETVFLRAQRSWRLMLISGFIAALLGGLWHAFGD